MQHEGELFMSRSNRVAMWAALSPCTDAVIAAGVSAGRHWNR